MSTTLGIITALPRDTINGDTPGTSLTVPWNQIVGRNESHIMNDARKYSCRPNLGEQAHISLGKTTFILFAGRPRQAMDNRKTPRARLRFLLAPTVAFQTLSRGPCGHYWYYSTPQRSFETSSRVMSTLFLPYSIGDCCCNPSPLHGPGGMGKGSTWTGGREVIDA